MLWIFKFQHQRVEYIQFFKKNAEVIYIKLKASVRNRSLLSILTTSTFGNRIIGN